MAEKKANLKEMTPKERISYIWDYYKFWIIGVIVAVIAMIGIVRSITGSKNAIAQMVFVNASPECGEVDMTDFLTQNGYDPAEDEVAVNTSFYLDLTSTDTNGMYTLQSLQTLIAAGGMDVLCADEKLYDFLGKNGAAADLSQYFSAEELAQLEDFGQIYYITDEETNVEYPAGIILDKDSWMVKNGYYDDTCIIGIVNGGLNPDAGLQILQYIVD